MAARVRRLEQEALSAEDRLAAAERNGWQVPNEGDIQVPSPRLGWCCAGAPPLTPLPHATP